MSDERQDGRREAEAVVPDEQAPPSPAGEGDAAASSAPAAQPRDARGEPTA
jgi:hypothetical protein